ncbi:MAG: hypothetical protein UZ15_CFX003001849 [Chloroflexi bacterium OLB15]|nr:MAG: hypothetical protein UZ15_CFX003001849 [Chloroflexi bacterium OLB15]
MHRSKRHNGSIYLTLGSVFFVILLSFFHRFTLAAQPQHEVIAASPVETTVFTRTILSELNNLGHLIEVQFPALLNAQPQTYRFTLTCDEGGETAFLSWAFDNRCGDSIELIVTPQNPETIPFVSLELQVTPNALFSQLTYTLTIEPLTPLVPLAQSEVNQVIDVYSDRTTTFTSTLSRPTGTEALDLSLHFPNLISFQPQTFRFTLICNDAYASQFELLGINANYGDLLLWENGKHCGDSITETYEPGYLPPIGGLEVQLLPFEFPIFFEYTLIIEPITALLPVALSDANHVINVPVTSATNFSQMISAPLGDQVDRITVRSTALAGGQSWDFAFTLFCIGTGTTGVEWVIADFPETLGCGHTITRHLQGGGAGAPVPSVDMIISLENHADPAHVQYTLIINPAGIQTSAQAPPGFVIALEGVSEFTGTLSSANSSDSINVSVSGLVAGYPRSIEFQLLCSGAGVDSIHASLQGGSSEFGCNESLHHTFDAPGQQLPLVIQQTQPGGNLTYLIAASPIFSPVAPPDSDPHTLVLLPAQASTFSNTISAPEGDSHDTILLDARHPTDHARERTLSISCVKVRLTG